MSKSSKNFYEFGPFRIDAADRLLLRDGEPVLLAPKVFDTLMALVQQPGRILEKDELMREVWPDSFVEEANLAHNVFTLRKALGEEKTSSKYIETIPRRGYRFVANVVEMQSDAPDVIVQQHSRSHIVIEEYGDEPRYTADQTTARESFGDLRWLPKREGWNARTVSLVASVVVILLGLVFYFWISKKAERTGTDSPLKPIAILPFKSISAGLSDDYLGLGMADALITKLSNIEQIIVRPTSAVTKYVTLGQDPVSAGRALKVEAVLDGSIQKLNDRIRVTVQLVSVADGTPLWAEKFDEKFTDIFTLQDSISGRVAAALTFQITGKERDLLAKRYTEDIEAYQLYLKGRYFWNKWTPENLKKSIQYYNRAIEKDPGYALAYAGMADAYNVLGINYASPKENFPKGRAAAAKALEIDDTLAEAHATMGAVNYFYDWNWPAAERELKRALELNQNYSIGHELYGYYFRSTGRLDEALTEAKRALELDPLSLLLNADLAATYSFRREYDLALDQSRKAIEIDQNSITALGSLARSSSLKGMYQEAFTTYTKMISLIGRDSYLLATLAYTYAKSGNREEAQKLLNELTEQSKVSYMFPYCKVVIYAGLGEKDLAFEWLERSYEEKDPNMVDVKIDPMLDPLRSDGRYSNLLRRMGLPQ